MTSLRKYQEINIYSIQNLVEQRISLAHPSKFNDPLDIIYEKLGQIKEPAIKEKCKNIRITCLSDTRENQIPDYLMWTHYADHHYGMALEFELEDNSESPQEEDTLRGGPVTYLGDSPNEYQNYLNNSLEQFRDNSDTDIEFIDTLFFSKNRVFEYENEYRIAIIDKENENRERIFMGLKEIDGKFGLKLVKVILGHRCSQENENLIRKINQSVYSDRLTLSKVNEKFEEDVIYES